MIRTCNCPTYSSTSSSYSAIHAESKRSRVLNSHYQEFKFIYRTFKF